ncbi:hypothetical protein AAHC03_026861 [Spirometra sp. Aus1]
MLNRKAKTDEDLLLDQARFLSNPQLRQVSNIRSTGMSTLIFDLRPQATSVDLSPVVFPDVIEHEGYSQPSDDVSMGFVGESGLPYVPRLGEHICDPALVSAAARVDLNAPRKSLFAKQLLATRGKEDNEEKQSLSSQVPQSTEKARNFHLTDPSLQRLAEAGPRTIGGTGLGSLAQDVFRIHETNMELLSSLSPEEILQAREEILASADPKILSFLMRDKNVDPGKLRPAASSKPVKKPTESKEGVVDFDLPIQPDPSIPHMSDLEPEKLEWMRDLPPIAKKGPSVSTAPESAESVAEAPPSQARFDLAGRLVPPDADVDPRLGLHHHGEEPERAGYTIGEIFHLASSALPTQRRIALSCLASSLAASRRAHHCGYLLPRETPTLISRLLAPTEDGGKGGVCFLLRWSLDQAVSELARASAPSGSAAGVSLSLVTECLRGLANLLSDDLGELMLDECFEWPLERICSGPTSGVRPSPNLCPSAYRSPKSGHVVYRAFAATHSLPGEDENRSDHAAVMREDPVLCLFEKTKLAHRIAWLLAPGPGRVQAHLSADAAGCWLPSVLLRGVRHSCALALQIFNTPKLVETLFVNFLPTQWPQSLTSDGARRIESPPARLEVGHGVPLPAMLKVMRVLAERSPSIRQALVSKFALVDRCIAYLLPPNSAATSDPSQICVKSLVDHLPVYMPLDLRIMLQLESLRCLTVCLWSPDPPSKGLEALKSRLDDVFVMAEMVKSAHTNVPFLESQAPFCHLVISLWTGWIAFLSRLLPLLSRFRLNQYVEKVFDFALGVLALARPLFTSETVSNPQDLFRNRNLSPALLAAAVNAVLLVFQVTRTDPNPATPFMSRFKRIFSEYLEPLFSGPVWTKILGYVVRRESVLTGYPSRIGDVRTVEIDLPTDYKSANEELHPENQFPRLSGIDPSENLDLSLLDQIALTAPVLPDLGMFVCFRYNMGSTGTCAVFWPHPPQLQAVAEPIDAPQVSSTQRPHYRLLPLVAAAIQLQEACFSWHVDVNLKHTVSFWLQRFSKLSVPPIASKGPVPLPYGLLSIESSLVGRSILADAQCSQASKDRNEWTTIWRTAMQLLPFIFTSESEVASELLRTVIFDSDPTRGLLEETYPNSMVLPREPWPQSDPIFHRRLFHHVRRLYLSELSSFLVCGQAHTPRPLTESPKRSLNCIIEEDEGQSRTESESAPTFPSPQSSGHSTGCTASICDPILPDDWLYVPVLRHYLRCTAKTHNSGDEDDESPCRSSNESSEEYLVDATACLAWILVVLEQFPPSRSRLVTGRFLSPDAHLTRLLCAIISCSSAGALCFDLAGLVVARLLRLLCPQIHVDSLADVSVNLPVNTLSLYDLYVELLQHFAAVSYSSPVFANIILFFCQIDLPSNYRRALWSEHQIVLRSLVLAPSEFILPPKFFNGLFEPEETDEAVLCAYASALSSGIVSPQRQPILSLIALHHLNRYIFCTRNLGEPLIRQLSRTLFWLTKQERRRTNTPGWSQELVDLLRRYKRPKSLPWDEEIPINSELVSAQYQQQHFAASISAELAEFYDPDVPDSRARHWSLFYKLTH